MGYHSFPSFAFMRNCIIKSYDQGLHHKNFSNQCLLGLSEMDICSRDLKAYVLTAMIYFSDEVSLTDTSDFVKLF